MDFDSILRITGRICPFVVLTLTILNLNAMFSNIEVVLPNYLYPPVDHWCSTPDLQHLPQQQQRYISIPYDGSHGNYETCSAYDLDWVNYTDAELAAWNWTGVDTGTLPRTRCVSGWTFDNSTFEYTATSEWDLVCDKAWIQDMLSPMYMAGLTVGSMISGPMSDSQGRLKTMLLFVMVSLLSGIGSTLAVNEWMFMLFRFTLAIGHRISGISSVIIAMEIIAPQYRSHTVVISRLFFSSGSLVVTCAAYFLRDFRVLQFSMAVMLVLLFALFFLIPESPRWLMAKGRRAEAKAAVLKLARGARTTIPDHLLDKFVIQEATASNHPKPSSAKDLFKWPFLVRWVLIIGVSKLASQFVYFGVTMNMDRMFGNIYLNVMLSSITEIPAVLLVMAAMHCLGNRTTAFVMFCLTATGGIVAMCLQVLGVTSMATTVTLLLVRCAASGSVVTTTAMSGELFPSAMRQTAVSLTSVIASVVTIFAPFVGGPIQSIWEPLPSLVFSVMCVVAAGLILLLPDARGKAMPETIEDSLNIARSSKTTAQEPARTDNKTPEKRENGPAPGHFQNGFILTDKSVENGAVTSPKHAGVQVGAQFYPAEEQTDDSAFDNWAFQDEFDIRL